MCGRFTQEYTWAEIYALYQLTAQPPQNLAASWNVAPTDDAGVIIREKDGERLFHKMRWGLLPFWVKNLRDGAKMINARSEEVADKPAFRTALKERRCLVPAGGFFEWQHDGKLKQPWYITRTDGAPLTMAGLWESRCEEGGVELQSFTILTTSANGFMSRDARPHAGGSGAGSVRALAERRRRRTASASRRGRASALARQPKDEFLEAQRAGLHRAADGRRAAVALGAWTCQSSHRSLGRAHGYSP